jgi:AraC family transcriptional regulator, regulatory protein of adaptative response / methylated-DNA-[protein]-cysteine methyltransferase
MSYCLRKNRSAARTEIAQATVMGQLNTLTTWTTTEQEVLWEAMKARDAAWDGKFYFGVRTTGVYCRPSCKCRLPLRKNVDFFKSPQEAEKSGFRACLRCHPHETAGGLATKEVERIREVCSYIRSHADDSLPLKNLAERAGLSPFHFQRSFKKTVGLTPRQFAEACRLGTLKEQLRSRASVTDAIYQAGFGSGSRVYERVDTRLGMTPVQYRQGGKSVSISYVAVDSPLGRMMIGATDRGLCFVQFASDDDKLRKMLQAEYPAARLQPMEEPYPDEFAHWMTALTEHLNGQQTRLDLPLDVQATAFQMKVWRYLQSIPYGSVQSYSEVAEGLGQPKAVRAVARACATNRVALVIPCHRVIRGSGELAGYRWGIELKRVLLDTERQFAAQR